MKVCTICGRQSNDLAEFSCPDCGKGKIARCKSCRENMNRYACKECGFEGP